MPSQLELIPCSYLRHETFFSEKRKCVLSVPEEFNN